MQWALSSIDDTFIAIDAETGAPFGSIQPWTANDPESSLEARARGYKFYGVINHPSGQTITCFPGSLEYAMTDLERQAVGLRGITA